MRSEDLKPERSPVAESSSPSRSPSPSDAMREFRWTTVATAILTMVSLFAVGSLTAASYSNGCELSRDLGPNNPITLGAFVTGVIALVGLYFLIETDPANQFKADEGDTVQGLAAAAILVFGFINISWEYLRVLAERSSTGNCRSQENPPEATEITEPVELSELAQAWHLVSPILSPNIILLTLAASLIFGICWAARDSIRMTRRGYWREFIGLGDLLDKQKRLVDGLAHRDISSPRVFKPDFIPESNRQKAGEYVRLISAWLIVPIVIASLCAWLAAWGPNDTARLGSWEISLTTDPDSYVWKTFAASLLSWLPFRGALFVHKRYMVSNGYLASKSQTVLLTIAFGFIAILYWIVTFTIGLLSFGILFVFLSIWLIAHSNRLLPIRKAWMMVNEVTPGSLDHSSNETIEEAIHDGKSDPNRTSANHACENGPYNLTIQRRDDQPSLYERVGLESSKANSIIHYVECGQSLDDCANESDNGGSELPDPERTLIIRQILKKLESDIAYQRERLSNLEADYKASKSHSTMG